MLVIVKGVNDSTNKRVKMITTHQDLYRAFNLLKNMIEVEIRWDCYYIAEKFFGNRDKYWIMSPYLHKYDGGSFFGRIGFPFDHADKLHILHNIRRVMKRLAILNARHPRDVIEFSITTWKFHETTDWEF